VTVTITGDGTPANISVLTEGAPNLDFTNAVTGDTCVTNPPDIGGTCTVSVNFTPEFAGPRYGAVVITDSGGDVLGTAYLQGTGTGPQMAFAPGTQIALPNSAGGIALSGVNDVRTDESRNVYIADFQNSRIVKIPWTGTGYGTPIAIPLTGQDFNYANGMAVDGAGNLLVITYAELVELPWNGSSYGAPVVLLGELNPGGVAVDGAGNAYVSDSFANTVTEIPRTAHGYGQATVLFNGLNNPRGLFVDGTGNVYVANGEANAVLEMPWTGSGYGAPVTVGNNLTSPTDVAVDAAGDVYIADAGNARAVMVPLTSNGFGTQTVVPFGPIGLLTVAVDELGNVFANNGNAVTELNVSTPPSLSFASTNLGATSSDSPRTVTVMNDGNAPLTFASLTYPTDFPEVIEAEGACSASAPLAAGTACTLPVNFAPTTSTIPGALNENLVLLDNNMNATAAPGDTQTIALNGTALTGVTAMVMVPTTTLTAGHAASVTPVSGAGGTAPLTYSISPGLPTGLMFNPSTGAITGTPIAASAAATYTVTVTDANGVTATATFSLAANRAVVAAAPAGPVVQTVYQSMSGLTPVSGSGGVGPLMYSISPGLPAGLVFNPNTGAITGTPTAVSTAATYTVTVTDANGATATAMFSMTVAQQPSQTVVIASPLAVTAGQAVTLTATVSATVAGTPVMPTGTVTFFDNGTQLGSAVNLVNGVAMLNVSSLPSGQTAMITAVYLGDGNFLTSTSTNNASVGVGVLDFTFTNAGVAAYTVAPGAVAAYNFALAPLNSGGYPGTVNFTVTGLPAGATASFTPSSEAANGGAVPVGMTVQTATATAHNDSHGNSPLGRGAVLALLLLPFGMKRTVREKLKSRMLLLVLLLAGTTAVMSGCASNNGFMLQSPQTYTLTVTATSGAVQHSQTVTLIVQ
jgi:sugar lactone lactonase YvrE